MDCTEVYLRLNCGLHVQRDPSIDEATISHLKRFYSIFEDFGSLAQGNIQLIEENVVHGQ